MADFHGALFRALLELGLEVSIHTTPSEIAAAIPFEKDTVHHQYYPQAAQRFSRALLQADRVFKDFRARFLGKCSPVHFFWGSFDLAVTRFSGRPAPPHPGGIPNFPDWVAREAYSHEVSSAGFWPGGGDIAYPAFYSYSYPAPADFAAAAVRPDGASGSHPWGSSCSPTNWCGPQPRPTFCCSTFCMHLQGGRRWRRMGQELPRALVHDLHVIPIGGQVPIGAQ